MSEFIVHGQAGSPYVRGALLGLEEKGLPWRLQPLSAGARSPEHLERHAFGRIPVLDHGDFRLYETQAILRYLDAIAPEPPLTPSDPRSAARMNQVCGITDSYVFPDISVGITFGRLVAPKFGLPVDEEKIAACRPKAAVCVNELARLLDGNPFMAGESLSIADLLLIPHLEYLSQTDEGRQMLAPHANLGTWIERMSERPSMVATSWEALAQRLAAAA